ncbi:MAG: hypothetical protein JNK82_44760 [Myxococcaceae bacterium]|nr:hypothetical protein [Myxococcaceae bacterium]
MIGAFAFLRHGLLMLRRRSSALLLLRSCCFGSPAERRCASGDGSACLVAANAIRATCGGDCTDSSWAARVARLMMTGWNAGSAACCANLGWLYSRGLGVGARHG